MQLRQGETLERVLRLRTGETPIDLTGSTFAAGIFRPPGRTVIRTITPSVDAASGVVTLTVTGANTSLFPLMTDATIWCLWTKADGERDFILWEPLIVGRGTL